MTLDPASRRSITLSALDSRIFSRLDGTWRFDPAPMDRCVISVDIGFEVRNLLAGAAVDACLVDVTQAQVTAFQHRCEAVAARRRRSAAAGPGRAPSAAAAAMARCGLGADLRRCAAALAGEAAALEDGAAFAAVCGALAGRYGAFGELRRGPGGLRDAARAALADLALPVARPDKAEAAAAYLFVMVQASPAQRCRFLFHAVDRGGAGAVGRAAVLEALGGELRAVAAAVPHVVERAWREGQGEAAGDAEALALVRNALRSTLADAAAELPGAVDAVFGPEAVLDEAQFVTAWEAHPELLDMLSVAGLRKLCDVADALAAAAPTARR